MQVLELEVDPRDRMLTDALMRLADGQEGDRRRVRPGKNIGGRSSVAGQALAPGCAALMQQIGVVGVTP